MRGNFVVNKPIISYKLGLILKLRVWGLGFKVYSRVHQDLGHSWPSVCTTP